MIFPAVTVTVFFVCPIIWHSAMYLLKSIGPWLYILGARLRRTKEVRDVVLSDTGPFETVDVERQRPDPMTLQVKLVFDSISGGAETQI